ncbi:MAG: class I SAM-dependent methyltransferase [Anaerolineaceae bacterium]
MSELSRADIERICDQQLFHLPYFRGMLRAVEQSFYEQQKLEEPIYDVGAGDGHFAWALFNGGKVIGADPWWQPLQEAKARKVYPLLIQAEGAFAPLESGCAGSAISNSVLEHIPDVLPVLDEVARVLKPGGKFYFAVPNRRFVTDLWGMQILSYLGLGGLAVAYSRFFNKIARHINLDPPEVWLGRLHKAGFDQVEYWNYFPVESMHKLERGHVAGLPNLLWKKLFGKWVLFKNRKNPFIHFSEITQLVENPYDEEGTCTFYIARRQA